MPAPIACPQCGADGTSAANQIIAQSLSQSPSPPPEVRASSLQPRLAARSPTQTIPPIRTPQDNNKVRDLIEAKQDTKRAVSAAVIVLVFDVVLAILSFFGIKIWGTDFWILLDVAIVGALAYGIYRFSRTCAVLMFVYYLLLCVVMLGKSGIGSVIIRAIFLYYFGTGTMGIFKYHKLTKVSH